MWPFTSLLQYQVGLIFRLKITYGEPLPNFLPHHVVPNTLWIQTIFELVGS
jgi:hypothetical protein